MKKASTHEKMSAGLEDGRRKNLEKTLSFTVQATKMHRNKLRCFMTSKILESIVFSMLCGFKLHQFAQLILS